MNIIDAAHDPKLFARFFRAPVTWASWWVFLKAAFALPMSEAETALFTRCTGRSRPFETPVSECWAMAGRRSGKSYIAALIAVYLAAFRDYREYLAPGEQGTVMVLAVNREQAMTIFRYLVAFLDETPMLSKLIAARWAESVELSNGICIEVTTTNYRSVRGRTVVAALCDEISFWRSDESRNPDTEILAALRPAMATIPTSLLVGLSSPYSRSGALYTAHERHWKNDGSPVLFWKAPTRVMNPSIRADLIQAAFAEDAQVAASEYGDEEHGIEFRSDVQSFLDETWIADAVDPGCHERPAASRQGYVAFVDPSGGRRDSFALGIAHKQGDCAFLDLAREWTAPLDPAQIVGEIAALVRPYGIRTIVGDAYSGEWCRAAFREAGIAYTVSALTASEIFLETGPLLAQGRARLIDHQGLVRQLRQLERRTSSGGRDRVSHPPGGHDDLAVSAMGALQLAHSRPWTGRRPEGPRPQTAVCDWNPLATP